MVISPVSLEQPAPLTRKAAEARDCILPDPLLLPYLQAESEVQAHENLCQLLQTHVDPIIAAAVYLYTFTNPGVLQRRHSNYEEEVRSETFRLLMTRLIALRKGQAQPIANFRAYAKLTARHECWSYLRKASREKPFTAFLQNEDASEDGSVTETVDPVQVMDLVMKRDRLRALWGEIMRLPLSQRDALLLSVRDGNGLALDSKSAVNFFLQCGVVTRNELAEALNVDIEQLRSLLKQLPLDDYAIAKRMGADVSSDTVRNMRTAARRRLERHVPFVSM